MEKYLLLCSLVHYSWSFTSYLWMKSIFIHISSSIQLDKNWRSNRFWCHVCKKSIGLSLSKSISICIPKISSTCIQYCEFFSTSDQGRLVILVLRFIMMRPIRKWFSMYLLILKKGPTFQKGLSHFLNVLKNYAEMK